MNEGTSDNSAISAEEVEKALQKILASPSFRKAPRHSRFLLHVVRKTLAGSAESIKESVIGVEVFDRPVDYDPGAEPMVRVEAGRLRSRLAEYYKTVGRLDQIHIELPRGTYVPIFSRNGIEPPPAGLATHIAVEEESAAHQDRPDRHRNRRGGRWYVAAIAIATAIGAISIAAFFLIRMLAIDSRPQAGRLEGSTLIISDASGQELWRKSFPDGFWADAYPNGLAPRLRFVDLYGDGHLEVLFAYHAGVNPTSTSTQLICYSDRGKEAWRWTPGRKLPELAGNSAVFEIRDFAVLKPSARKRARIVVSSSNMPEYPDQIAILDSHGKTLSEYWHSGHLPRITLADLDGDGREEILATGISNGYHAATLIVLDPDRVFGASTEAARPEIQIHNMGTAGERIRLLFPRSDLNTALEPYNEGREISVEHGRTLLMVQECRLRLGCDVLYDFDNNFHLLSVEAGDQFRSAHAEFYRNDKDNHAFTQDEEREFQKVRCLVGCESEYVALQAH